MKVPCAQNEQKRSIHCLFDAIVREERTNAKTHTPSDQWSRVELQWRYPACEAMEQADPPNTTITASKPPEPSLHPPMMNGSGRITAASASNILSRRRYLLPAFLGTLWTRRSQRSPWHSRVLLKNESGLLPEFHVHMDSLLSMRCIVMVTVTDSVGQCMYSPHSSISISAGMMCRWCGIGLYV